MKKRKHERLYVIDKKAIPFIIKKIINKNTKKNEKMQP